jgi:hypothetical protein
LFKVEFSLHRKLAIIYAQRRIEDGRLRDDPLANPEANGLPHYQRATAREKSRNDVN